MWSRVSGKGSQEEELVFGGRAGDGGGDDELFQSLGFLSYHEVRTESGYFEGLVWESGERWAGDRYFGVIYL